MNVSIEVLLNLTTRSFVRSGINTNQAVIHVLDVAAGSDFAVNNVKDNVIEPNGITNYGIKQLINILKILLYRCIINARSLFVSSHDFVPDCTSGV